MPSICDRPTHDGHVCFRVFCTFGQDVGLAQISDTRLNVFSDARGNAVY